MKFSLLANCTFLYIDHRSIFQFTSIVVPSDMDISMLASCFGHLVDCLAPGLVAELITDFLCLRRKFVRTNLDPSLLAITHASRIVSIFSCDRPFNKLRMLRVCVWSVIKNSVVRVSVSELTSVSMCMLARPSTHLVWLMPHLKNPECETTAMTFSLRLYKLLRQASPRATTA